jgi:hypothetical protein
MKTAVEWLVEQITDSTMPAREAIKQAKELEKQQIINAYDEGKVEGMCLANNSEYKHLQGFEYYNETYKNTKQ